MLLRAGEIVLRPFSLDLSTTAYDIRNHESVRRNMGDPSPIGRAAHDVWVRVNLLEAQRVHLFIVEAGAEAIGLALLRNFKGDAAEIGLMVQEAHRRPLACYKAAHLIGYYGFEVLDLANLVSLVPRHNARALEFNRACGFEESAARSTAVYHALELDQARSRSHPTHRKFRARYRVQILES